MKNRLLLLLISLMGIALSPAAAQQEILSAGGVAYTVEKVVNANYPVTLAFTPDGRLFYTEKTTGHVRVIGTDGVLQTAPVITLPVNALAEQGMLGLAVDPNYAENGYIWVVHTAPGTARDYPANNVVRFTEADGVGSDPETMLTIPITGGTLIHNGGNLHFDREGRLYLSVGDYENPANAQDMDVMQGKIHRFDVTEDGLVAAAANPFEGSSVYAYGLRNSWDFDFDVETDYIYASENGDKCDDEINLILRGFHYGHGADYTCGGTAAGVNTTYYFAPLVRFTPTQAPTGIVVYDNPAVPEWMGNVFFCVWNDAYPSLRMLTLDDRRRSITRTTEIPLGAGRCRIDIEIAPNGSLYMTNVDQNGGQIWRLSPR